MSERSTELAQPQEATSLKGLVRDALRVMTFRASEKELLALTPKHLLFGIVCAWLVGMGRYWDNPRASWPQHLGLGSVAYVLVLSLLLWVLFKPVVPERVHYSRIAAFVSLTAPPAILYAIPVERFMPLGAATQTNVIFLAVVALWRVALLMRYGRRALGLKRWETGVAALLPLCGIVTVLAILNLEHVVFNIMAGVSPEDRTANDGAYTTLVLLTFFSFYAVVPLMLLYLWMCIGSYRNRKKQRRAEA